MLDGITLVTGATGAQGGSVARRLLASRQKVRALTRRANSRAGCLLREQGAEVIAGDLADVGALARAMNGCRRVFGVTSFWEHFGTETVHGKNLVDAAREAHVEHLVLSTLPSSRRLSGGTISVPHFESKAEIEQYARASDVPTTFTHLAFYFENFLDYFVPEPDEHGLLHFGFPQGDTPLAGLAVEEAGAVVEALFRERGRFLGKVVGVVSEELRGDQYAYLLGQALGREVRYDHIPAEVYAELPFPGADDLAAMFDLNRRFVLTRADDIALTRSLHPTMATFSTWARAQRPRFEDVIAKRTKRD
ncbi:hypothetical protein AKJ09_06267 [Labilithrix luteola]|uniref:NmrA-like domain-containing protein n=1 Tax=Labilithrix luteola TaxID=1391654 RepID=A0A0K1Q1E8_9BACT|nr:NmrA/HSCARG family protein [Labilithrix luteola]AKU99603.1 hypothetical protein AKJ09_06267 [Labilithrix luteola]